jgi:valyl-tRNA synthetase
MMETTFDPHAVEDRIAAAWEKAGAFRAGRPERLGAEPFTIVIPPPNVTGSLHMGHALNNTLQDILCRFQRMRGRDVLWQPGTDHAGIATQMVVERQLMERQEPNRQVMGREAFVRRVWDWTADEGLSRAVVKVFVDLYRDGLIYKDKRLVNWDPKLLTAISDLEVVQVETKGHLWHFKYPIVDDAGRDTGEFIIVATTRPETMLGDTGVAVHPDDARYTHLHGKKVRLPLVGRLIPIVADTYSDPEKGTGAVKITPAHDFNDFEVGKRHDLEPINILDEEAKLALQENDAFLVGLDASLEAGIVLDSLHGLPREVSRTLIVEMMEAQGLVDKIEPHLHTVPHGDRSGAVIEPWLTDQWYVDAKVLAAPALEAVRSGKTSFVPKNWEKTYFDWLENIQPWCISRQLWWGHQIPAWYGPDGTVFVENSEAEAELAALTHYGVPTGLVRDEDVLDTWFSSALWPFSTLGWPDETPEVARYYPTNVLVTGFDIIFFWVARMMMMGLHFIHEVPFADVYIHALVRDEKGAKMSKSKGNVVDPLGLIDTYGADSLRFTLAAMAAQGRDIKLSIPRIEGYRNFATKIWNAARFGEMNGCTGLAAAVPAKVEIALDRWILGETQKVFAEVTEAISSYRFNDAANAAYRFVWNIFCDWYLELVKPVLQGEDGTKKTEARETTAFVLDRIFVLLHPFMPFLTEELWAITAPPEQPRSTLLALADWPSLDGFYDAEAEAEIGFIVDLVSEVRSVRAEISVPAATKVPLVLVGASKEIEARVLGWVPTIERLARLSEISFAAEPPSHSVQMIVRGTSAALSLEGIIDFAAETIRLEKEIAKSKGDAAKFEAKLANGDFIARAPEEVVEENREKLAEALARAAKLEEARARLDRARVP